MKNALTVSNKTLASSPIFCRTVLASWRLL
jgi:hypothetical protein